MSTPDPTTARINAAGAQLRAAAYGRRTGRTEAQRTLAEHPARLDTAPPQPAAPPYDQDAERQAEKAVRFAEHYGIQEGRTFQGAVLGGDWHNDPLHTVEPADRPTTA